MIDIECFWYKTGLNRKGSEQKRVETVISKLKKINKREKPQKKEVRVQKENNGQLLGTDGNNPKGKPGKSVTILVDQIKENEQALLKLLDQA